MSWFPSIRSKPVEKPDLYDPHITSDMIIAAAKHIHANEHKLQDHPWDTLPPGIKFSYQHEAEGILLAAFKAIK